MHILFQCFKRHQQPHCARAVSMHMNPTFLTSSKAASTRTTTTAQSTVSRATAVTHHLNAARAQIPMAPPTAAPAFSATNIIGICILFYYLSHGRYDRSLLPAYIIIRHDTFNLM